MFRLRCPAAASRVVFILCADKQRAWSGVSIGGVSHGHWGTGCREWNRVSPRREKEVWFPFCAPVLRAMPWSKVCKNLDIQCPVDGLVEMPKQHTPQGWPDTEVLVRREIPLRMLPCKLMDWGFVLRRSRNLSAAMVAMRKHPSVIISAGSASKERMRVSHAAKTANGIGVASDLSNGIRVFDFRKSETVWLWR